MKVKKKKYCNNTDKVIMEINDSLFIKFVKLLRNL